VGLTEQGHAYALELLFRALHGTVGPCRFEGTTFRSVALGVPLVRRAAAALVGEPLVGPERVYDARGRLYGWLTRRAFRMLSSDAMDAWPRAVAARGLTVRRHHSWIYWDTGEGLPPRIDHLIRFRLLSCLVPVDECSCPECSRARAL
jgi:hypothetical protein